MFGSGVELPWNLRAGEAESGIDLSLVYILWSRWTSTLIGVNPAKWSSIGIASLKQTEILTWPK